MSLLILKLIVFVYTGCLTFSSKYFKSGLGLDQIKLQDGLYVLSDSCVKTTLTYL